MTNEIFTLEDEVIDLEWASEKGHKPPKKKKYRFKVDSLPYISETETATGKWILEKAAKVPPEKYILRKKVKGNWLTVNLTDVVDFTEQGVEKFKTLPNDQTEGESVSQITEHPQRREFLLLEEDEEYLESLQLDWEAVTLGGSQWIFVHRYLLTEGYNVKEAVIAVLISPGYPTAQLDMIYFYPALSRQDTQPINNLSLLSLDGKTFQQWSRHRTSVNPWRTGIDNLSTHLPLAEVWLLNEFNKRPRYAASA